MRRVFSNDTFHQLDDFRVFVAAVEDVGFIQPVVRGETGRLFKINLSVDERGVIDPGRFDRCRLLINTGSREVARDQKVMILGPDLFKEEIREDIHVSVRPEALIVILKKRVRVRLMPAAVPDGVE